MKINRFARKNNTRYGKRHVPGQMNKTEEEYANMLHLRTLAGEIIKWEFESVTLKLAKDCRYTPDFAVWLANGEMEMIDTKGSGPIDEKSRVKLKCAAEKFPMFHFAIERKLSRGAGWQREDF